MILADKKVRCTQFFRRPERLLHKSAICCLLNPAPFPDILSLHRLLLRVTLVNHNMPTSKGIVMAKITINIDELKCIETEDPLTDELYFISSVEEGKSSPSPTKRNIRKGDTLHSIEILKDFKVSDRNKVVLITVFAQRAVKDTNSRIINLLEWLADKTSGIIMNALGKKPAGGGSGNVNGTGSETDDFIKTTIENIIAGLPALFKKLFRDTCLFVIAMPIPEQPSTVEKSFSINNDSKSSRTKNSFSYKLKISLTLH